jgi:transposase
MVHIIVAEKEVQDATAENVIAIDPGIKHTATVLGTHNMRPKFYGKEVRKARAHFFKLRRVLQEKRAYEAVKRIGNH